MFEGINDGIKKAKSAWPYVAIAGNVATAVLYTIGELESYSIQVRVRALEGLKYALDRANNNPVVVEPPEQMVLRNLGLMALVLILGGSAFYTSGELYCALFKRGNKSNP